MSPGPRQNLAVLASRRPTLVFSAAVREFVAEGGAGMMPVLLMGLTAVSLSGVLVFRPRRSVGVLVVGAVLLTLSSGAMGTFAGIRASVAAGSLETDLGARLHPAMAAIAFVTIAILVSTIGVYRLVRAEEAS